MNELIDFLQYVNFLACDMCECGHMLAMMDVRGQFSLCTLSVSASPTKMGEFIKQYLKTGVIDCSVIRSLNLPIVCKFIIFLL